MVGLQPIKQGKVRLAGWEIFLQSKTGGKLIPPVCVI